MSHAIQPRSSRLAPNRGFRSQLKAEQPEVLAWIEQHLCGESSEAAIELTSRYFETAARWGETLPLLRKARLNIELASQLPTIDPRDRWMTELPIGVRSGERLAIGRLLRAVVTVSQACA